MYLKPLGKFGNFPLLSSMPFWCKRTQWRWDRMFLLLLQKSVCSLTGSEQIHEPHIIIIWYYHMPLARERCQVSTCTETTVGVGTSTLFHCVISTIININQQNYCRPKVSTKPHFQLCDKSVDKFALQMYLKSYFCKTIAYVEVSQDLKS